MRQFYLTYRFLIILIFSLCLSAKGNSQVYDVFSGKAIHIHTNYIEVQPTQEFIKKPFDIEYLIIESPVTEAERKFNEAMLPLSRKFADDETEYLRLLAELKSRKEVYNTIEQSKNNSYRYEPLPKTSIPLLINIQSKSVSLISNRLFFAIEIAFKVNGSQRNSTTLTLTRYYVADMRTGEIKRWKNTYSQETLDKVLQLISEPINNQYRLVTSKLNLDEISMLERTTGKMDAAADSLVCEDICPRILLKEANFIWYGWGLQLTFPEYSETSKIYVGRGFQLFLPFAKAKEVTKLLPDFQFTDRLEAKPTNYRDFAYYNYAGDFQRWNKMPDIDRLLETIGSVRYKKLVMKSYRIRDNGDEIFVAKQVYAFNANQQKISFNNYTDKEAPFNTTTYTYSPEGKILRKVKVNLQKEIESDIKFEYDTLGNIVKQIRNSDGIYIDNYFYNGSFAYKINEYQLAKKKWNIIRVEKKEGFIRIDDYTVRLDTNGNALGSIPGKYYGKRAQLGYDTNQRIVEIHEQHDRYQTYIYYDDQNRLTRWLKFDGLRVQYDVKYSYKDSTVVPFQRKEIYQNGQSIKLSTYEWEFYDE